MARPIGVHAIVRRTHEDRIIAVLRDHGALSRAEIAPLVGLSRTTLSEITNLLIERGAVVVSDTDAVSRVGRGRPAERLTLDPNSGQFVGIDFAHDAVHIAVADASHDIIASGAASYDRGSKWNERVDIAFDVLDGFAASTGLHYGALQGIGIGVPTPLLHGHNLGEYEDRPTNVSAQRFTNVIESAFLHRFDAPLVIDNNTQFAALAEAEWSNAGVTDLVYLRLSHGCGGGLVVGGQLVAGSSGFAGEIGHITADHNGALCRCGKYGCLETIASMPALLTAVGDGIETPQEFAEAAEAGHPGVLDALARAGEAAGRVLAGVATALAPSEVIIGGPVVALHPSIFDSAAATFQAQVLRMPGHMPEFRRTRLGEDAAALGALIAVLRNSPLLVSYPTMTRRGDASATTRLRSFR